MKPNGRRRLPVAPRSRELLLGLRSVRQRARCKRWMHEHLLYAPEFLAARAFTLDWLLLDVHWSGAPSLMRLTRSPGPHRSGELMEHRDRHFPAHAAVGHTLAVRHSVRPVQLLPPVHE